MNESLLLAEEGEKKISYLMNEAWNELNNKNDDYSIPIVLSYIGTLLNTAERFYSRQFNSRKKMCNQLASDFLKLLKTYYRDTVNPKEQPSVFFFSEKLNITPNYLVPERKVTKIKKLVETARAAGLDKSCFLGISLLRHVKFFDIL